MKQFIALFAIIFSCSAMAVAQDDVYFVSSKKKADKKVVTSDVVDEDAPARYRVPATHTVTTTQTTTTQTTTTEEDDTYYCGSMRSVDEYNRRDRFNSAYATHLKDSLRFEDSIAAIREDYEHSKKMKRFDGYNNITLIVNAPLFDVWVDPWYDPWFYDPWYRPFSFSWGVRVYDPWYNPWYDPWYRPWGPVYVHHYWGPGWHWGPRWYGPVYVRETFRGYNRGGYRSNVRTTSWARGGYGSGTSRGYANSGRGSGVSRGSTAVRGGEVSRSNSTYRPSATTPNYSRPSSSSLGSGTSRGMSSGGGFSSGRGAGFSGGGFGGGARGGGGFGGGARGGRR